MCRVGSILFCLWVLGIAAYVSAAEPVMRVHFIDVGQADATLVEFPNAAMLVDTGFEQNDLYDGEDALANYLGEFFHRRTDLGNRLTLLVITHPHIDHTRGIPFVLEHYPPRNAVTNGQERGSGKTQQRYLHRIVEQGMETPATSDDIAFCAVTMGMTPFTNEVLDPINCPEVGVDPKITALWGAVPDDHGWSQSQLKNINDHSIVLCVEFGEASMLLTADLEDVGQREMITRCADATLLDVDLYRVGHHGSKNGTLLELLDAMTPMYAVVSMGPASRQLSWTAWDYGHPNKTIALCVEGALTATRPPIEVPLGVKKRKFVDMTVSKAMFATGWDGDVVIEAKTNGEWRVVRPNVNPTLIDVNTATADELTQLPGIGPVKAQAIVAHRQDKGAFATVEDLLDVKGIGPATLNKVKSYVTVSD